MLLKPEHMIYNEEFKSKEIFEEFFDEKLEIIEEVYSSIKARIEGTEKTIKGHQLRIYMEQEYGPFLEELEKLKEELQKAKASLVG